MNANNAAVVGRVSAVKRSRAFNEAITEFISVDKDAGERAITSLEELLEAAARVATGKSVKVTCPHCETEFGASIGVDSKVLTWLLERLLGRAVEVKDVNIRSEQIVALLSDKTPMRDIEVVALDPRERAERQRIIEAELAD